MPMGVGNVGFAADVLHVSYYISHLHRNKAFCLEGHLFFSVIYFRRRNCD